MAPALTSWGEETVYDNFYFKLFIMGLFSVDEILKSDTEANDRINTLRKKKRKLGIELEVLKEFYAQHDVKVRQELAKENLEILSKFY